MSVRGEAVDVSFWPIRESALQGCLFLAGVGADLRGLKREEKKLGQKRNRQRQDSNLRTRT